MSSRLELLLHNRWSPAILAELERARGARVAALAGRLGASRESILRALDTLLALGLVERNPGYGHPLRPEYLLTPRGSRVAAVCAELIRLLEEQRLEDVGLRKWSLPVLASLDGGRRYSELRVLLPGATSRALALTLKQLASAGLVEREVRDGFPPATAYRTTPAGQPLGRVADRLARALAGA